MSDHDPYAKEDCVQQEPKTQTLDSVLEFLVNKIEDVRDARRAANVPPPYVSPLDKYKSGKNERAMRVRALVDSFIEDGEDADTAADEMVGCQGAGANFCEANRAKSIDRDLKLESRQPPEPVFRPGFDDAADDTPPVEPVTDATPPISYAADDDLPEPTFLPPLQPIQQDAPQDSATAGERKTLLITSPTINGFKSEYIISLISSLNEATQRQMGIGFAPHAGNSLIQAARNVCVREFMKTKHTHMLMVDDDIGWDARDLMYMLDSGHDFCAGAVPLRRMNWGALDHAVNTVGLRKDLHKYALQYNVNIFLGGVPTQTVQIDRKTGAMEVEFAGTAFILVSRKAIEKMIAECKDLRWYYDPQTNEKTYDLFDPQIDNKTTFNGEDVSFCNRWKSVGGKIYCYPRMRFSHSGVVTLSGSFMDAFAPQGTRPVAQAAE